MQSSINVSANRTWNGIHRRIAIHSQRPGSPELHVSAMVSTRDEVCRYWSVHVIVNVEKVVTCASVKQWLLHRLHVIGCISSISNIPPV